MSIQEQRLPDGSVVKIQEVDFKTMREEWNEYQMANGTTVRVKTVVLKIFQMLDDAGMPKFSPDGEPMVLVRSENKVTATSG